MTLCDVLRSDRWQTKHECAHRLGITPREFEALVERTRKAGELAIMSGAQGYRLPQNAAEYADNLRARRIRALHQLETNRGEKRALRAMEAREARPLVMPWSDAA